MHDADEEQLVALCFLIEVHEELFRCVRLSSEDRGYGLTFSSVFYQLLQKTLSRLVHWQTFMMFRLSTVDSLLTIGFSQRMQIFLDNLCDRQAPYKI